MPKPIIEAISNRDLLAGVKLEAFDEPNGLDRNGLLYTINELKWLDPSLGTRLSCETQDAP